jgi:hypothetical protein
MCGFSPQLSLIARIVPRRRGPVETQPHWSYQLFLPCQTRGIA